MSKVEKRKSKRLKTDKFTVEYVIKGLDTIYSVEVINISAGGMCFLRNAVIRSGDLLTVKFPFKSRKLLFSAKVLRVDGREVAVQYQESEARIESLIDAFNYEYPLLRHLTGGEFEKMYKTGDDEIKSKSAGSDDYLDIEP